MLIPANVVVIDEGTGFSIPVGTNQPFLTLNFNIDALPNPPEACLDEAVFSGSDSAPGACVCSHTLSLSYITTITAFIFPLASKKEAIFGLSFHLSDHERFVDGKCLILSVSLINFVQPKLW